MITLPSALIGHKNQLSDNLPWLILLEIQFSGETIRLVRNEADITWDGHTWTRFPFEIDNLADGNRGEAPAVSLRVSNISRVMQSYIEPYDGGVDAIVILRVVHAGHLNETTPALRLDFTVLRVNADAKNVSFTLGSSNLFRRQFPCNRFLRNSCRWRFKSGECAYVGSETICDKTLTKCRNLNNSVHFGGFPGVGYGGLKL